MNRKLLALLCTLFLFLPGACGTSSADRAEETALETESVVETNPAPEEPSPVEDQASCSVPAAKEDIAKLLAADMEELKPELKIDISQMT